MKTNQILAIGFGMLTVCVIISAFGAHSLKNLLLRNNTKETFDLAARYCDSRHSATSEKWI